MTRPHPRVAACTCTHVESPERAVPGRGAVCLGPQASCVPDGKEGQSPREGRRRQRTALCWGENSSFVVSSLLRTVKEAAPPPLSSGTAEAEVVGDGSVGTGGVGSWTCDALGLGGAREGHCLECQGGEHPCAPRAACPPCRAAATVPPLSLAPGSGPRGIGKPARVGPCRKEPGSLSVEAGGTSVPTFPGCVRRAFAPTAGV